MNTWTKLSIEYADQDNYLDSLFEIYPITPNPDRTLDIKKWSKIEAAFNDRNDEALIKELLGLKLFPIKDSYVAYLKRDKTSIKKNPETVSRLAARLYDMGLNEIYKKCTAPKETNRQIGPLFKRWIDKGTLGLPVIKDTEAFLNAEGDAVFNASDAEMQKFATEYLGYDHEKGLDFVARYDGKYIIGEAKFLTDFGGHQAAQFADAISTITSKLLPNKLGVEVIKIAICDGVLYIKGKNKMHKHLETHDDQIILSGLLLKKFIHSIKE